ncbi:translation initiation factor IF-2-like [Panicum virgatum]|uniref:translation initiation factor IF-2-like n=1 Tax=Panicum virgatum TaxID=38727 RepID=UPI0019D61E39|nr:translation initiation factor IF-2-like [Panicum virgatum]
MAAGEGGLIEPRRRGARPGPLPRADPRHGPAAEAAPPRLAMARSRVEVGRGEGHAHGPAVADLVPSRPDPRRRPSVRAAAASPAPLRPAELPPSHGSALPSRHAAELVPHLGAEQGMGRRRPGVEQGLRLSARRVAAPHARPPPRPLLRSSSARLLGRREDDRRERGCTAGGPRRGLARREEGGGVPPPPPLALRPRSARIWPAGQRGAARPRAEGEQARAGGMGSSRRHGEGGGRLRRAGQLRHARSPSGEPAPPRPVVSMASSMGGRSSRAGAGPLPRRRERAGRERREGGAG